MNRGSAFQPGAEVGERLSHSARSVDTVCRLSGDEFIILMEDIDPATSDAAGIAARRVLDALSEPFMLNGHTITITASIGISSCPSDGASAVALIRNADDALYRAKQLGKNGYRHFSAMLDGDPVHGTVFEGSARHRDRAAGPLMSRGRGVERLKRTRDGTRRPLPEFSRFR